MNDYEITYLSAPELEENARVQLDASVDDQINQLGGSASYASPHVPKRLYYPIQKQQNASLRTLQIELDPDKIDELHTFLTKENNILRFYILQTPRREEQGQAILDQLSQSKTSKPSPKPVEKQPTKPVSDEAVEAGIEKALSEEVK